MEIRRLKPEEYPLLKRIADGIVPDARASIAIVAEDGGEPVGRMFVVCPAHMEGTWVLGNQRLGIIGKRLFERIQQEVKAEGLTRLMAYSTSGQHDSYLHRLGFERMPWTVWGKEL